MQGLEAIEGMELLYRTLPPDLQHWHRFGKILSHCHRRGGGRGTGIVKDPRRFQLPLEGAVLSGAAVQGKKYRIRPGKHGHGRKPVCRVIPRNGVVPFGKRRFHTVSGAKGNLPLRAIPSRQKYNSHKKITPHKPIP